MEQPDIWCWRSWIYAWRSRIYGVGAAGYMLGAAGNMLGAAGYMVGGPCDYCVSPSPFDLDVGTLDFGTSDSGLTIRLGYI